MSDTMNFYKAIDTILAKDLNVHTLGMFFKDTTTLHYFHENKKYDIRSLSKTVMTLILGLVVEKTDLTLESYVYPIIKDKITLNNEKNLAYLNQIQIKHCLNHTLGFDRVLLMRQDIKHLQGDEFLNYLLNEPLIHKPGSHYLYSNAGFYLLSAVLENYLDEGFLSFADEYFFKLLNITDYKWESYGPYCAGATRLWLKANDLMKIAKVLLQQEDTLISSSWIEMMKTITTLTPKQDTPGHKLRRYAYGQGIWLAKEDGIFFAHGTDSQMLIIVPQQQLIFLAQSDHRNLSDVESIINDLLI